MASRVFGNVEDDDEAEPFLSYQPKTGKQRLAERALWFMRCLGLFFIVFLTLAAIGLLWQNTQLQKDIDKLRERTIHSSNCDSGTKWDGLASEILSKIDFSADPCDDFYQFACGKFIADNSPPKQDMYIPTFSEISDTNRKILQDIVYSEWPLSSDFFDSCMNISILYNASLKQMKSLVDSISQLDSNDPAKVLPLIAKLNRIGVDAFFTFSIQQNIFEENSKMYPILIQGGIPNGDSADIEHALKELLDLTNEQASQAASQVSSILLKLKNSTLYPDSFEDALVNMTYQDFLDLSGLDFDAYFLAAGTTLPRDSTIIVSLPDFFQQNALKATMTSSTPQALKYYLTWTLFASFMSTSQSSTFLNKRKSTFLDMTRLGKAESSEDLTSFCIELTDSFLPDFVGHLFTELIVDDLVISDIKAITDLIKNAFRGSLPNLKWLDEESRKAALYKLEHIVEIIGHPNVLYNYRKALLEPDTLLANIHLLNSLQFDQMIGQIGHPYVRENAEFPATIVNAFYSSESNTINFPAGILESPMFSTSFPKMLQFARMGYVIGHELTHGFDNNGRLWNAFGVYDEIMDPETSKLFEEHAQCLVDQYSKYEVAPGFFVNGQQTLGENIADNGGVKNARRAYKAWIKANGDEFKGKPLAGDRMTNDQLFWVMLGQTWCAVATEEALISQVLTDEHSPSKFRVNGPLSNNDDFARDFHCPSGSKMNPKNKCLVW